MHGLHAPGWDHLTSAAGGGLPLPGRWHGAAEKEGLDGHHKLTVVYNSEVLYIYGYIYIWSNIELVEECTCYVLLYYIEILDDWCIIYI